MKKEMILIVLLLTALLLSACTGADTPDTGPLTMPDYSTELSGTIARFDSGAVLLLSSEGPVVLGGEMNFDGLQTGDSITIYCDGIMESYPMQAIVKEMALHSHGTTADLPDEQMEQLLSLGYTMEGYTVPAAYRCITMEEAAEIFKQDGSYLILDVRRSDEFAEGHIPNAFNLSNEDIQQGLVDSLPDRNQTIYVYCRSGNRSKQAAEKLVSLGYTDVIEFGGIIDWPGEIEK